MRALHWRPAAVWLTVLALTAAATSACGTTTSHGVALPDETLEVLGGGEYELRQPGRARVLNLWATWCVPCRAELPAFEDVAARVDNVDIVGVNTGDEGDAAQALVDELGLSFTQVLDPDSTLRVGLRVTGMPATVFVAASGDVVEIHNGELSIDELEALLVKHFRSTFDET